MAEDIRDALFDLWSRYGTSYESDSSEGWELVNKILERFEVRPRP